MLCNLLNERKPSFLFKKLKCLYSSFKHGLDVKICHSKCKNKSNILFLIQTKNDNVFGAFTSTQWKTDKRREQRDENSFLFLLNSSDGQFKPKCFDVLCAQSMAVWYHPDYFCLIGTGYDISVYKVCHKMNKYTYVSRGNYALKHEYQLNGGIKNFIVKSVEIFVCS